MGKSGIGEYMEKLNKKVAICTISSHNYMAYGLTCLLSAKKYNNNCDVYYLVADDYKEEYYKEYKDVIEFVSLDGLDIEKEAIINMAFKYNIVEFNTAVKPKFYSYLFSKGYDMVIYLDPDMECYYSFDKLINEYNEYSIIVTPHKLTEKESELIEDSVFLNNGIYNLGFIAMNRSKDTDAFLNWWDKKLRNQCFVAHEFGMATDQIWVELASTLFDGFCVIKDEGMNVAFWNINERSVKKRDDIYFSNNTPLIFFHFSSLSAKCSKEFLDKIESINPGFISFYNEHIDRVKKVGIEKFSNIEYKYSKYDNGQMITEVDRWIYGFSAKLQDRYTNPFNVSGDTFYKFFCARNKIGCDKVLSKKQKLVVRVANIIGVKKAANYFGKLSFSLVKTLAELI